MNHDAINQRIQTLESELAGLKAELNKPDKFEFKYTNGITFGISSCDILTKTTGLNCDFKNNFRHRQTKENAQADFQLQKELMCIGALAEQIDPDYKSKIDFTNDSRSYMIFYDYASKTYVIGSNREWKSLGVVYMPKDVAEKVCQILNNKQVEL